MFVRMPVSATKHNSFATEYKVKKVKEKKIGDEYVEVCVQGTGTSVVASIITICANKMYAHN